MFNDNVKLNAQLRKVLIENPTLPVVVMVGSDVVGKGCYWWFSDSVKVKIDEVLEYERGDEYKVYTDKDEFENYIRKWVYETYEDRKDYYEKDGKEMAEVYVSDMIYEYISHYRPYWEKAIIIYADC